MEVEPELNELSKKVIGATFVGLGKSVSRGFGAIIGDWQDQGENKNHR